MIDGFSEWLIKKYWGGGGKDTINAQISHKLLLEVTISVLEALYLVLSTMCVASN